MKEVVPGVLDAQRHQKPRQPAQIERRQDRSSHVMNRILALPHECAAQRCKEHHEDDDERQRRGGHRLKPVELGEKRVNHQSRAAYGGNRAIRLHALGREKLRQLINRRRENQQHQDQDSHAARLHSVDANSFLQPPVEIEHAQQGRDHQGAESQTVAKGLLHGIRGAGVLTGIVPECSFTAELTGG